MYQALAAYAAAMLTQDNKFIVARTPDGMPVWALTSDGKETHTNLHRAHKLSILGAMRLASDTIGGYRGGSRAYNTLHRRVRHVSSVVYNTDDFLMLSREHAIDVLLRVARG